MSGRADGDRTGLNSAADDGACPDLCALADLTPRQQDGAYADVRARPDLNSGELQGRVDDARWWCALCMGRGDHHDPRADPSTPTDRDTSGALEVALLADPRTILNPQFAARVTLKNRAMTDVDIVAKEDVGGVEDEDSLLDNTALADRSQLAGVKAAGTVSAPSHEVQAILCAVRGIVSIDESEGPDRP